MNNPNPRKMSAYGTGTAAYVFASDAPPAWLVAATGAEALQAAWEAENAKGRELSRVARESGKALVALRNSRPLAAELELAEREHADKERAVDAQARRALAALKKLDAAVYGSGVDAERRLALAADYALTKQKEALDLWDALLATLGERDAAYRAAGAPGRHWTARSGALPSEAAADQRSERVMGARVLSFDADAVEAMTRKGL